MRPNGINERIARLKGRQMNPSITHERLLQRVNYDPGTGIFVYLSHRCRSLVGKVAGSVTNTGYIEIGVDGQRFLAHRLAWFYVHGHWPKANIDHRDGDGKNNRLDNLREAHQSQNCLNRKMQSNNQCGQQGIVYDAGRRKWRAYANLNGKHYHAGRFDSLEDAIEARRNLSLKLHGEFSSEHRK